MEKISLVMTTLNPDEFKLNRALQSAQGFDRVCLHIDPATNYLPKIDGKNIVETTFHPVVSATSLKVNEAYDLIISEIDSEWICCFCDHDFFDPKGLAKILESIRRGDFADSDVVHFKIHVSGSRPYHQWGAAVVNAEAMEQSNQIPAGSFFRKSVWQKSGGFKGTLYHDWIFWLRAISAGCRFSYFDSCVYWFMMREDSSAFKQLSEHAGNDIEVARQKVLEYARQ